MEEIDLINSKPEMLIKKLKAKIKLWKQVIIMLNESKTILTPLDAVETAEFITEIMIFESVIRTHGDEIEISSEIFDELKISIDEFLKISDELIRIESENGGNLEFCMDTIPSGGEIDIDELKETDLMIHIR